MRPPCGLGFLFKFLTPKGLASYLSTSWVGFMAHVFSTSRIGLMAHNFLLHSIGNQYLTNKIHISISNMRAIEIHSCLKMKRLAFISLYAISCFKYLSQQFLLPFCFFCFCFTSSKWANILSNM